MMRTSLTQVNRLPPSSLLARRGVCGACALAVVMQTPYGDAVRRRYPKFHAFLFKFIKCKARRAYYTLDHESLCYAFWRFVSRRGRLPPRSIGRHWFGVRVFRPGHASQAEVRPPRHPIPRRWGGTR